jgi:hypothetical protein
MSRLLLSTVAALGMIAAPALAQTSPTEQPSGASQDTAAAPASDSSAAAADEDARSRAVQNAEGAGMQNVTVLDRVFVVQGTTPQGETVFMLVNPPGALIGLGGPVGNTNAAADTNAPAITPYQATQMQPASPQMWDPEGLETRLSELGFSDVSEMKREGDQVSLKARKDDKGVVLIIDLKGGEIWDEARQQLGSLNGPAANPAN